MLNSWHVPIYVFRSIAFINFRYQLLFWLTYSVQLLAINWLSLRWFHLCKTSSDFLELSWVTFDQSHLCKVSTSGLVCDIEPITQKLRPYMCWHIWIFMISKKYHSFVSITYKRCEFGTTRHLGTKHDLLYLILT